MRGSVGGQFARKRVVDSPIGSRSRLDHRVARVDEQQRDVGACDRGARACDAELLDRIVVSRRPAVSTTVSGMPAISTCRSTVSRVVPGIGVDDRRFFADEAIQQARFADVRRADQHDGQPFAQHRAAFARAQGRRASRRRIDASRAAHVALAQQVEVLFGKIECRFRVHAQLDQRIAQRVNFARKLAGKAARRRAHGRGRRRLR